MGFFARDRAEKVVEYHHYPEPSFITRRHRLRWWYRFLLGRPMDGVRWSNATFWSPGSRGEASWWLRLAGYQRLLIRLALLWAALIVLPLTVLIIMAVQGGELGASALSLLLSIAHTHLLIAAPVLIGLEVRAAREHGVRLPWLEKVEQEESEEERGARWVERRKLTMRTLVEGRRQWRRDVVEPLAMALSESLDNIFRQGDTDWIHVPRNYATPGGGKVEIMLPSGFSGSMNAKTVVLQKAVTNKLGLQDPVFDWQLAGRTPRVLVSAPPTPPAVAHFRDYREMLERTVEFSPFLGVTTRMSDGAPLSELLSAEMVSDSPHLALSAGSGAGKSMMAKAVIMQALRWGWGAIILDWKAESHSWAKGLPGVKYCVTEEAIHDALERIGEEVDIRKTEGMAGRANVLVVCEEWNMTAALLSEYWSARRSMADQEERRTMPLRSPALRGFGSLTFAGRQFGLFCFLIAQRMSSRVFNGNADLRENFMIRLMARYSVQTWRMLIPEMKPIRKPKELGRWVVWANDEVTTVQGILISDAEAREFASGGVDNPLTPFSSNYRAEVDGATVEAATMLDDQWGNGAARGSALADRPAPVLLRKLVDLSLTLEYLGVTEKMLRQWRDRDRNFPQIRGGTANSGFLYDAQEVTDYVKAKLATRVARKEVKR